MPNSVKPPSPTDRSKVARAPSRYYAEAAKRLVSIASAEAEALGDDTAGAVYLLTCAAYALAKAMGVDKWETMIPAEQATWGDVQPVLAHVNSKGGKG